MRFIGRFLRAVFGHDGLKPNERDLISRGYWEEGIQKVYLRTKSKDRTIKILMCCLEASQKEAEDFFERAIKR